MNKKKDIISIFLVISIIFTNIALNNTIQFLIMAMDKREEILSSIKTHFTNNEVYNIGFYQQVVCDKLQTCKLYRENLCKAQQHTFYDLKRYYDTISKDVIIDGHKIDIVLTNSNNTKQQPVLILFFNPNEDSQNNITSKFKCICIKPDLIKDTFVFKEGITEKISMMEDKIQEEIIFYNFGSKEIAKKTLKNRLFVRFKFYKSGRATCTDLDDLMDCEERFGFTDKESVIELNIPYSLEADLTALGYAYLRSKNYIEKVCGFCKYYRRYSPLKDSICTLYNPLAELIYK